jgi:hypothetical protein
MNRERAETHLRLMAEAEMRDSVSAKPVSSAPWSADSPNASFPVVAKVAQALTAVGALDAEVAEDILADFAFAVGVRQGSDLGSLGLRSLRLAGWTPFARPMPFTWPPPTGLLSAAKAGAAAGERPAGPGAGEPDLVLPVGVMIPFRQDRLRGELVLMSYAHTISGARFAVAWWIGDSADADRVRFAHPAMLPVPDITTTDDKGASYGLRFTGSGGPEWTGDLILDPEPKRDVRWLDIALAGGPAVRIALGPGSPDGAGPQVRKTGLSFGEHLLNTTAEQLLTIGTDVPLRFRAQGPYIGLATGLGEVVAALEAADVLSALSPVPGQLATLCASLRVYEHGITAAPAHDLPEPWLSVLAHYHRRKPEAPGRDGYAAAGLALPELDGIRLALLGVHNVAGGSVLDVLVSAVAGPVPLSVWVHDSGGRWHATRQVGSRPPRLASSGERRVRLQLTPPLTQSTPWIEVVLVGMSAEVRAKVPLRWRYPP